MAKRPEAFPRSLEYDVAHVVRSDSFAGVERYVCQVANGLARRGHRVCVVGGDPARMLAELDRDVRYSSAASVGRTWLALAGIGRVGLVHAHMTAAEVAAVGSRFRHRAPVVATRHFPDSRGRGAFGSIANAFVPRALAVQIAISKFVADGISEPSTLLYNGVPSSPTAALSAPRVLMMQRLEPEKAPEIGVRAFGESRLTAHGWELVIAGSGRLEQELRRTCNELGLADSVRFLGRVSDTDALLRTTSIFLAPAAAEPFGLAVVEAMAHGIPVVAAAGGGHVETVGEDGGLFPPGDADVAASHLARLGRSLDDRREMGGRLRARQQRLFSLDTHLDRLEQLYESVLPARPRPRGG